MQLLDYNATSLQTEILAVNILKTKMLTFCPFINISQQHTQGCEGPGLQKSLLIGLRIATCDAGQSMFHLNAIQAPSPHLILHPHCNSCGIALMFKYFNGHQVTGRDRFAGAPR